MATLQFDIVESVAVLVHADVDPADAEWTRYVERLGDADCSGILVLSDGASPSAAQRRQLVDRLEANGRRINTQTAVLTGSLISRGVVTALSWFAPQIRAFEPSRLDEALGYLEVEPRHWDRVLGCALRLRAELVGAEVGPMGGAALRRELSRSFRAFRAVHGR